MDREHQGDTLNDMLSASWEGSEIAVADGVPDAVARIARGPRVMGELRTGKPGPTLICVGGVHGNEPAGVLGLDRIFQRLETAGLQDVCGRMVGLVGNRQALARNRRFLKHDLNRFWSPERCARLRRRSGPLEAEAEELRDLDKHLERLLAESEGQPVYFLDLHTTSGQGPAFANLDDTLPNREFALNFPVPLVVGIEEELAGTLTGYLFERGAMTLGFESGQHEDAHSVDLAEAAIWIALEASGILPRGSRAEVAEARRALDENRGGIPHVVEIRHRHGVQTGDGFKMRPGYRNFQNVRKGEVLAADNRGEMTSAESAMILMPLYQEQGEDGFFLVRRVHPFWLKLSAVVRQWHLERYLHLLPGVVPHAEEEGRFTVDRRYARWLALEIFHLLGFRRRGVAGPYLLMGRRPYDR